MGIDKTDRERLFVACHRRCCVCHRYCGVRMEIHTSDELKAHRKQWLSCCAKNPAALASSVPPAEGGALERLLNELMFNEYLSRLGRTAAVFEVRQFRRAIGDGTFGW